MKVAVVTGGSRGIGAQTVKQFATNGYAVIAVYKSNKQLATQLQQDLLQQGCDVHLFCADVGNAKQVQNLFEYVGKYFKKVDVLVNNAGVSFAQTLQDTAESDFDNLFNVNVKGVFNCCKYALPLLKASNGGSIVNVSSIWGLMGASCESVYSASKHAVVGFSKSLAQELALSGVTVNCVCPPIVLTDMCAHLSQQDVDDFCRDNHCKAYTAQMVAQDIFCLATNGQTGVVLQEK